MRLIADAVCPRRGGQRTDRDIDQGGRDTECTNRFVEQTDHFIE